MLLYYPYLIYEIFIEVEYNCDVSKNSMHMSETQVLNIVSWGIVHVNTLLLMC